MKRKIIIGSTVAACLFITLGTAAALDHSGYIESNETWTLADSPHIVTGNVTVNGATLTIEPGTEIRFNVGKFLRIGYPDKGILIAQGTATDKIIFTSNADTPASGDWYFIDFSSQASDSSILENCIVEYGGGSTNYPSNIYINRSNPKIINCIIRHGKGGIYITNASNAEIRGCEIRENEGNGIYVNQEAFPTIKENNLINNGSYPLYIKNSSVTVDIDNTNNFKGNTPQRIYFGVYKINTNFTMFNTKKDNVSDPVSYYVSNKSNLIVQKGATLTIEAGVEVRFDDNMLSIGGTFDDGGGKLIAQGTDTNKIIFTSNKANQAPGDWTCIYFGNYASDESIFENCIVEYGGGAASYSSNMRISNSNPAINKCVIRNGKRGMFIQHGSNPIITCCDIINNDAGIYVTDSHAELHYNNLFGNTSYGILVPTAYGSADAKNNWWGDASGPGGVGTGAGDTVSGYVAFQPWLTAIVTSPCPPPIRAMPWLPLLLLDE